jgi:hypothetical protein
MSQDRYPSVDVQDALRTVALVFKLEVLSRIKGDVRLDPENKQNVVEWAIYALQLLLLPCGLPLPNVPNHPADDLPDSAMRVLAALRKDGGLWESFPR